MGADVRSHQDIVAGILILSGSGKVDVVMCARNISEAGGSLKFDPSRVKEHYDGPTLSLQEYTCMSKGLTFMCL